MNLTSWKSCFPLCVSLLIAATPRQAAACVDAEPFGPAGMTFFAPEIIGEPAAAPLFADPIHNFYTDDADSSGQAAFDEINLDEWEAFFEHRLRRQVWSDLLYRAPLTRLDALIFALKGTPTTAGAPSPEDAAFMAYADRPTLIAALFYVGFARRVEPYATERSDYDEWEDRRENIDRTVRDAAVAKLIRGGTQAMEAANAPFLKQRYAFQILRLHFFNDAYEACLDFHKQQQAQLADSGSIHFRALGYAAGALYKLGRYAEANYIYSQIYDKYAPMRLSAYWSFHPQEETDWRRSLSLARTSRERAVLWQLLGIHAHGLRAMKEIRAIDPRSDLLPLLLVREVAHAELAHDVTESRRPPVVAGGLKPEIRELIAFVDAVARAGDASKPWAWDIAAGHLHALAGDPAAAATCLDRGSSRAPDGDAEVVRQIRISHLYAALNAMRSAEPAREPMLANELVWLKREAEKVDSETRAATFLDWARRHLSDLYRRSGDPLTALYLSDDPRDPVYADNAAITRIVEFVDRPVKTPFQSFLHSVYPYSHDELVELQGLNLLYAGDLEKAAALLGTVATDTLYGDPFLIHINDCHDCDHEAPQERKYTKAECVERMARLQKDAAARPAQAAQHYFDLANALYNVTYYGNARVMYGTLHNGVAEARTLDCSLAEYHYRRAMELSTDRELKAKACFMTAKCELNRWYNERASEEQDADFKSGNAFRMLRDSFSDTRYYKEILKECGYFRTYVQKSRSGSAQAAGR